MDLSGLEVYTLPKSAGYGLGLLHDFLEHEVPMAALIDEYILLG